VNDLIVLIDDATFLRKEDEKRCFCLGGELMEIDSCHCVVALVKRSL
jgi:hypothetical protein